jgi:hypothetical protein
MMEKTAGMKKGLRDFAFVYRALRLESEGYRRKEGIPSR